MNDRTSSLISTYKPRLAIVAYTSVLDNWSDCYLESHAVNESGHLMEGKPLKQETIEGMVDIFFDDRQNRSQIAGMIPENLLWYELLPGGNYSLTWWQPAQVKQIFFSPDLHIPSGKAWMPALIYKVTRRSLYIFAANIDQRPEEKTPLFRAPFHNVSNDGLVCLGNAKVKKPAENSFKSAMQYWEDMFWLSEFSHLHGTTNPTKSNLSLLWKRLVKDNKITWRKLDELKSQKASLKKLLE